MHAEPPTITQLRAIAAAQGVVVEKADLVGVLGFLRVILPELQEIEESLPPETAPAEMLLP